MTARAVRNLVLLLAAIVGMATAAFVDYPGDPIRPYLLVLALLALLKLNLEFWLGLTMHLPRFIATPPERGKRQRAVVMTWLLAALMACGFVWL